MLIRSATLVDVAGWAALRGALWPDAPHDALRAEAGAMLAQPSGDQVTFVAVDEAGAIHGFVEAALRRDYVNGCETSPVAFLEGIYVRPEHRAAGIGRRLVARVSIWAREQGCSEIASDALIENADSHAFHAAIGFEETERVVYFRQRL